MHVSIIQAGMLLARLGRPEVKNCIEGLEQYSYAYEECAEQAADERQRRLHAHRGLQNLRRYFELIIFQAYLQSAEPDTMETHESFESFVKNRPGAFVCAMLLELLAVADKRDVTQ